MHRSHEYLVKIAVEVMDGVFIHQVLGKLKEGDIPAEVRTRAIQAMIDNYFRPGTVIQAGYPIEMRYAGPREALLHALIRQNFGCSHLIVGRDHAGVGSYYGPFDAHHIFDRTCGTARCCTKPLKIDVTFYCRKCYGMATAKTCPHDPKHHISISGTQQREMLSTDADIPPEFSRPEVVAILQGVLCEPEIGRPASRHHDHRADLRHPHRSGYARRRTENSAISNARSRTSTRSIRRRT